MTGYVVYNGYCSSCPSNCDTCYSIAVCQTCSSGYTLKSNGYCYYEMAAGWICLIVFGCLLFVGTIVFFACKGRKETARRRKLR